MSDLRADRNNLILEVQNQGPGKFSPGLTVDAVVSWPRAMPRRDPNPPTVTVSVPVPTKVLATETVTIPFSRFGYSTPPDQMPFFNVTLDPRRTLTEERTANNAYSRQVHLDKLVVQWPRGDYKSGGGLPDLVITDITQERNYLIVHFVNKGKGSTGADFGFSIKSDRYKYASVGHGYRVPEPGVETKTGGFTMGLVMLQHGDVAVVEATIDPDDRVRESDKKNNTFKKKMRIR